MGLGLWKPKQIFVFDSVWQFTEYSVRKPRMEDHHKNRSEDQFCGVIHNFLFKKYNTQVVNGTKDRKGVINSTSE
jgi:hypothetical protein